MKAIGIDIGTTTICAVLLDADTGMLLVSEALPNTSTLSSAYAWEKQQDPGIILTICNTLLNSFLENNDDITSIGVTGQMHGIVYVNVNGASVSPLYTWQDGRGNLEYKDSTSYSEYLTKKTEIRMATGFGLTTHFYNLINHMVPEDASTFCTISDFIAMSLSNEPRPLLHQSMAASLGLYDLQNQCFDAAALKEAGIQKDFLPAIASTERIIGTTKVGIPVSIALGDNQASFLGSVNAGSSILVNVGTGSQISFCSNKLSTSPHLEYRPYINNSYLIVGSPLCGGYSYSLLKNFFEEILQMFDTTSDSSVYEVMNEAAYDIYNTADKLTIDTRLNGTRADSSFTGSVKNLTANTFHPAHLVLGVLQGICNELYDFSKEYPEELKQSGTLVGSGNGIRMNPLLQKIFCDTFHMTLKIPLYSEEAAYGSALFSLYTIQYYKTLAEIQNLITYQSKGIEDVTNGSY